MLSLKDAVEDPRKTAEKRLKPGDEVEGTVVKQDRKGYWVELFEDVAGYLPAVHLPKGVKLKYRHRYRFVVDTLEKDRRRVLLKWQEERRR